MGKNKKRFNWKARQVAETVIDDSEQKKIKVDLEVGSAYDECNALVLPAKKRNTKVKKPDVKAAKLLSKTQRKKLEKIVERKKKKQNRSSLLESLAETQVSNNELSMLTSITEVQTKGLKRRYNDNVEDWSKKINIEALQTSSKTDENESFKVNSIKKGRKWMRMLASMFPIQKKKDPNVIGVEPSSSEEISSDEEAVQEIEKKEETIQLNDKTKDLANVVNDNVSNEDRICAKSESNTVTTSKEKNSVKQSCVNTTTQREPAVFVSVKRTEEIQAARLKLPILAEEQVIMEAINENPIILLVGETGSGKTTQVPQFLYEAGYSRNGKLIGITEPRRVAAISMAKRVGEELNLGPEKVSYLIRFEGNVTPETEIKFMTDGVLLKEIQSDFLLNKYSVIILDEAHERSVYTDILMGLLSRIVPLRHKRNQPLKLIIMSATLRVEDFTKNYHLFKTPPPVIKVESRQFPVSIHFNKRTNPDYLKEAFRKTCRIHTQLPDGGILVFLTGQQEVNGLVSKLRKAFPLKNKALLVEDKSTEKEDNEDDDDLDMEKVLQKVKKKRNMIIKLPEINLDNYDVAPNDDTELDMLDESDNEQDDWGEDDFIHKNAQPMWVLPLYSILPTHKQAKVFQPPPEGYRLCVVATNVAETSLTIPGIKYIVDTGKVKTKLYDKATGVTAFSVVWTSKSGANQRAGRAGRTGPGHCYRLYSSAMFNDEFEEWAVPEMQKRPVDELVLQMKSLGIQRVVNFPFPSPPDHTQLKVAEQKLSLLGALKQDSDKEFSGRLTPLGESMARFPVAPRFAKMLCLSHQHNLLEYTVAIAAAMSVQEILLNTDENGGKVTRKKWNGTGNSLLLGDAMVLLRIVGAAEYANSNGKLDEFCAQNNVRQKAIIEVRKIRLQLTNEINLLNPDLNLSVNPKMEPPNETQARLLRQIVLSGFVDQVARKCDEEIIGKSVKKKPLYNTPDLEEPAQIHSSCALYKEYPEWIIYQEIYETNKIYLRGVTAIEPEWLPIFAPSLCNLAEPLETPAPFYDKNTGTVRCRTTGTFGRSGWELPIVEMEHPEGLAKYKWFAVFLLDGSIFQKLEKYKDKLLSSPQIMTKSWSKFQPRTEYLLKALASEEVDSKSKLLNVWTTNPKFLLAPYQSWLPDDLHNEIAVKWPPT
ncbi:probable ATP-dependent RNA helicase kurz [Cimex lectularius]|uniref:RNA helicase n=1 Tax=Cimex lectularius TaxID=79782 RepID=A0A8I6RMM7_CIMLE|nr:probable ATP-dependent RNA helicase kurz [Cimex lectularius]